MPSVSFERQAELLIIEIDNPPVNAVSHAVRTGLRDILAATIGDHSISSIVIACAGRTFSAGADITEFDLAELPEPSHNDVYNMIETMRCPVIAALHGSVLGGGLELALACHYRVASDTAKIGLPEVKLGVIPGAGGTQRLPRLTGIAAALDMMTSGAPVSAQRALELGIVDRVVEDDVRDIAIEIARSLAAEEAAPPATSTLPMDRSTLADGFFDTYRQRLPSRARGGGAAREIVDCVEAGMTLPFSEALAKESRAFHKCKNSPESAALRYLFLAERRAGRLPSSDKKIETRPIESVAVIGAGTMGGGIAMNFANAGIPVTVVEINDDALRHGLNLVRKNYETSVAKGRISQQQCDARMGLIRGTLSYDDIADADLVIEAAFENMEIKQAICQRLGETCKPGAIIGTNTSSLDVNALASASGRPEDFIGMHFFSPANVMKLVEVVRGDKTSPGVLASVMALAKAIGKVPVVSGVCFGFIGNRMLESYLREAEFLLMEGASPAQIDRAIEATGMAMGPCRMIDLAGVDVAAKVVLENQKIGGVPDDPAYRAVVRKLFEDGRFGQKTKQGYYRYEGRNAHEDPEVAEICAGLASRHGITRRATISDREIVERCLYPLINEGARILEEGIAYRAGDIDVVWANGYGFPAYKGGPMYMAERVGFDVIQSRLNHYAESRGNPFGYWTVSPWLMRNADGSSAA